MNYYACLFCGRPVRRSWDADHGDWVHDDGFVECRRTIATPIFEQPVPDPHGP